MNLMLTRLRGAHRDQRGASLVEYALLVALIAVVCIVAVTLLSKKPAEHPTPSKTHVTTTR